MNDCADWCVLPASHDGRCMNREDQLRHRIAVAHDLAKRALEEQIRPWVDELTQIEMCKPPQPVTLPDGRVMIYAGPLPTMVDGKARYSD